MAPIDECCEEKSGTTRIRTGDTRIFSPMLYQLSYGTVFLLASAKVRHIFELTKSFASFFCLYAKNKCKTLTDCALISYFIVLVKTKCLLVEEIEECSDTFEGRLLLVFNFDSKLDFCFSCTTKINA